MSTVGRTDLGRLGDLLGEGGQARVYRVRDCVLPDATGPLAYKEYRAGHRPGVAGLNSLVAVREGLDHAMRARLDRFAAWPLRVVEEAGEVLGVLLPLIPDRYFQVQMLPGTGSKVRRPREIQNLLIPPARARLIGMPEPAPGERLGLCRQLAAALHFVHRNGFVIGDLNAKNALFCVEPVIGVMLVDCDAIRRKGTISTVAQLNAPDWDPPERTLSQATDRYKFGLFVLRCLSTGEQASTTRDVRRADATLDDDGRTLLRDALGDVPQRRPTAQDWGNYFDARLGGRRTPRGTPPIVSAAIQIPTRREPPPSTRGWTRDPSTGAWVERSG
jgi:hypothetical protein